MLVREPMKLLNPFLFEPSVTPDQRICSHSSNTDLPSETPQLEGLRSQTQHGVSGDAAR
jgi:hypothetical protein